MTVPITKKEISFFKANGFLLRKKISPKKDVANIARRLDQIVSFTLGLEHRTKADTNKIDACLAEKGELVVRNPHLLFGDLRNTTCEQNAFKIIRSIFTGNVSLFETYIIYKPALNGIATNWHQDAAYLESDSPFLVSFWIPLQNVDPICGTISYLPALEQRAILPHHEIPSADGIRRLALNKESTPYEQATSANIMLGECAIHHMFTPHYVGPNASAVPRRSFVMDFIVEDPTFQ